MAWRRFDRYTLEKAALAYWGLGLHLGRPVSQNAKGHLLGHVRDLGLDPANPTNRLYATSARQIFHTDSTDIVGLLCLQTAKRGGLSALASSVTVFNEILRVRPDLTELLAAPWYVDRKGEVPAGMLPYYQLAIHHHHDGLLTTIFARDFLDACQRFPEVPRRTPLEAEALDLMLATANRDDVCLSMELAPGDMQFLHNHQILHARTAYEVRAYAAPSLCAHPHRWVRRRTGPSQSASGTCCACGCRRPTAARCHRHLPSGTDPSRSAAAAASPWSGPRPKSPWCPSSAP
jgi:hypothetical protein